LTGDVIRLWAGSYCGPGNRDLDFNGKGITLRCVAKPDVTFIDCEGAQGDRHRGIWFHSGENSEAIVSGITFRGGWMDKAPGTAGGAIRCENGSSPHIIGCYFENNYSGYGGAIAVLEDSSPFIAACIFRNNTARIEGGAIYCNSGSAPEIVGCTFYENTADLGGAISGSYVTVRCSDLYGNIGGDWTGAHPETFNG